MLNSFFEYVLFASGSFTFSVGQLFSVLLLLGIASLLWRLTKAKWRIDFFQKNDVDSVQRRRFEKYLRQLIILFTAFLMVRLLKIDAEIFSLGSQLNGPDGQIVFRYSIFIVALIVLVGAWLIEWFFSNILINKYEKDRKEEILDSDENPDKVRSTITKLVQYIVLVLAGIAVINKLDLNFEIFPYTGKNAVVESFTPSKILTIVLIFLLAQIISWIITQIALFSVFKRKDIDEGSRFAINQLLKYVIYFTATMIGIQSLGIDMTIILGGAAALLVGIGLGLQQTFNDFFSGLVLLFERSVSVGDVMHVGGEVGAVKKIGLRSSIIETRANVSVIVPNSKLVNESVKNWTHFVDFGRFEVLIGVQYGSDTALVKKLLLIAANEHHQILDYPVPFVRFNDFADSALSFGVYFFSNRFIIIEDIKSDVRFRIDELFREHGITIPFPQRDIWIRKEEGSNNTSQPPQNLT